MKHWPGFLFGGLWNLTVHRTNYVEAYNQFHPLVASLGALVKVIWRTDHHLIAQKTTIPSPVGRKEVLETDEVALVVAIARELD
jgi:hypothetical protein